MKVGVSDDGLDYQLGIANKSQIHYESFATDSLIFGLRKDAKSNGIIYTLDWNGNQKYKINLNTNVLYFSVNEKDKKLYCIDAEDHILIYDLK